MGEVAPIRVGNVVNSQPHVLRLRRAATSLARKRPMNMPGKDRESWLGEVQEGQSPSWESREARLWAASGYEQPGLPLYL
jgi:hypothetical protein